MKLKFKPIFFFFFFFFLINQMKSAMLIIICTFSVFFRSAHAIDSIPFYVVLVRLRPHPVRTPCWVTFFFLHFHSSKAVTNCLHSSVKRPASYSATTESTPTVHKGLCRFAAWRQAFAGTLSLFPRQQHTAQGETDNLAVPGRISVLNFEKAVSLC